MACETESNRNQRVNVTYDWEPFMNFILETSGEREKIGPAWFLFLDIARRSDRAGICSDTYAKLAKRYGVAKITVKTWRQHLCRNSVIESYSRGQSVAFRLLEPYVSFLKPSDSGKDAQEEKMQDLLALKKLLLKTMRNDAVERAA